MSFDAHILPLGNLNIAIQNAIQAALQDKRFKVPSQLAMHALETAGNLI